MAPRQKIAVPEVRGMRNLRAPVDTFVQAKPQYTAEVYGNEAKSLKDLKSALGIAQAANSKEELIWQKKQDKKDKALATKQALIQQLSPGNFDHLSAENTHPDKSSVWQATYNEKLGYNHAVRWQSELVAQYEKEKTKIGNFPEWMAERTQKYMNSLGENPHYIAGASPIIQQASANLTSGHAAWRKTYQQDNLKAEIREERVNILGSTDLTEAEALKRAWNITQSTLYSTGLDPSQSRADFITDAIAYAENEGGTRGLEILKGIKLISAQKGFPRYERDGDQLKKIPSGMSSTEIGVINAAEERIETEQIRDKKDAILFENNRIKENDLTIEQAYFEETDRRAEAGMPFNMSQREIRAFIKTIEKNNNWTGQDFSESKFRSMVNMHQNNTTSAMQREAEFQAAGGIVTKVGKTDATNNLISTLNQEIRDGKITSSTQARLRLETLIKGPGFVGVTYQSVWSQVSSTLNGESVAAKMKPFNASTQITAKGLGWSEYGDRKAAGTVYRMTYQHALEDIRQYRQSEDVAKKDGTVIYDGIEYNLNSNQELNNLHKAINKNALTAAVESDEELAGIALGPDDPKNKGSWNEAFVGGSAKPAIYKMLIDAGVIEEPVNEPETNTTPVKFENWQEANLWLAAEAAKLNVPTNNPMLQLLFEEKIKHLNKNLGGRQ